MDTFGISYFKRGLQKKHLYMLQYSCSDQIRYDINYN